MLKHNLILVRLGELTLKGKNRREFMGQLIKNIQANLGVKVKSEFDRLFVPYSLANLEKLAYVFGISSYSPVQALSHDPKTLRSVVEKINLPPSQQSFRISVNRHWKDYPETTSALEKLLGSIVDKRHPHARVNLKNPDFNLELEIRQKQAYLFWERRPGLGGLPTGINGQTLHLISGGIDSPVAALEMMKRGVHVDFLNFITPPSTDPKSALKVHEIIKFTTRYQTHARLFQINFSKLLNLIALTEKTSYRINLMRRSFYRIADQICQRESYLGISNGESLGQVASQTLESIATISSQTQLPIYRPLLTFDKLEIIAKAKKYGTYDFSILPAQETCELFAPTSPTTQPKQIVAAKLEAKMQPFLSQLEEDALQNQCQVYEFTQSKR